MSSSSTPTADRTSSSSGAQRAPAVGDTVQVYWPDDDAWYQGVLAHYFRPSGRFRVNYDDGDTETLNLSKERWRHAGEKTPPPLSPSEQQSPASSPKSEKVQKRVSKKRASMRGLVPYTPRKSPKLSAKKASPALLPTSGSLAQHKPNGLKTTTKASQKKVEPLDGDRRQNEARKLEKAMKNDADFSEGEERVKSAVMINRKKATSKQISNDKTQPKLHAKAPAPKTSEIVAERLSKPLLVKKNDTSPPPRLPPPPPSPPPPPRRVKRKSAPGGVSASAATRKADTPSPGGRSLPWMSAAPMSLSGEEEIVDRGNASSPKSSRSAAPARSQTTPAPKRARVTCTEDALNELHDSMQKSITVMTTVREIPKMLEEGARKERRPFLEFSAAVGKLENATRKLTADGNENESEALTAVVVQAGAEAREAVRSAALQLKSTP